MPRSRHGFLRVHCDACGHDRLVAFSCKGRSRAKLVVSFGLGFRAASDEQIKANFWIIKGIGFPVSISTAYVLKVLFVFHAGRHKRTAEVVLFFGFSLLQFVLIWFGLFLISRFGWEMTYANYSLLILGVTTNYFACKKIVFEG